MAQDTAEEEGPAPAEEGAAEHLQPVPAAPPGRPARLGRRSFSGPGASTGDVAEGGEPSYPPPRTAEARPRYVRPPVPVSAPRAGTAPTGRARTARTAGRGDLDLRLREAVSSESAEQAWPAAWAAPAPAAPAPSTRAEDLLEEDFVSGAKDYARHFGDLSWLDRLDTGADSDRSGAEAERQAPPLEAVLSTAALGERSPRTPPARRGGTPYVPWRPRASPLLAQDLSLAPRAPAPDAQERGGQDGRPSTVDFVRSPPEPGAGGRPSTSHEGPRRAPAVVGALSADEMWHTTLPPLEHAERRGSRSRRTPSRPTTRETTRPATRELGSRPATREWGSRPGTREQGLSRPTTRGSGATLEQPLGRFEGEVVARLARWRDSAYGVPDPLSRSQQETPGLSFQATLGVREPSPPRSARAPPAELWRKRAEQWTTHAPSTSRATKQRTAVGHEHHLPAELHAKLQRVRAEARASKEHRAKPPASDSSSDSEGRPRRTSSSASSRSGSSGSFSGHRFEHAKPERYGAAVRASVVQAVLHRAETVPTRFGRAHWEASETSRRAHLEAERETQEATARAEEKVEGWIQDLETIYKR